MASKRKRSRPTKIAENYEDYDEDDFFQNDLEESSSQIQGFMHPESVDILENGRSSPSQYPAEQRLQSNELVKIEKNVDFSPGVVFKIPRNLQFNQLLKGELAEDNLIIETETHPEKKEKNNIITIEVKADPPVPRKKGKLRRVDTDGPKYSCSTCKYVTNRSDHFKRHLITHSEAKPLKCNMCDYSTGRTDHYKRHLQKHGLSEKGLYYFMASKRKKSRPTKIAENPGNSDADDFLQNLLEESTSQLQENINQESVDVLENGSFSLSQYLEEQKLETDEPLKSDKNADDLSGVVFKIPRNLQFNQLLKGELAEDDLIIETEPPREKKERKKVVTTEVKADPPMKKKRGRKRWVDTGDPKYSCSTCKYVTNRSDHFKRHLITHSQEKPLKCKMCDYSTGRSDHYKRHLQRHGLNDQEVIDCCEKSGLKLKNATLTLSAEDKLAKQNGNKSNVLKRYKPRQPIKRYECEDCGYATYKSSHYHRHRRTHNTGQPYTCENCQKCFKLKHYLKKHKCSKLVYRRCPMCKCIFIDSDALLKHKESAHKDDVCDSKTDPVSAVVPEEDSGGGGKRKDPSDFLKNIKEMASEIISTKLTTTEGYASPAPEGGTLSGSTNVPGVTQNKSLPTSDDVDSRTSDIKKDLSGKSKSISKPSVPTNIIAKQDRLKCLKCGIRFAKFKEYSAHPCT